ncbi:MAG: hypothetical protein LBJ67_13660 [Planctomycetaceae bacterium]|jgi:hypothetical protein|nr:hypothetical protein [Planctomycetaceae bacterium]
MENNNITETDEKKNSVFGWKVAIAILSVALLGTIGVFIFFSVKNNNENIALEREIDLLSDNKNADSENKIALSNATEEKSVCEDVSEIEEKETEYNSTETDNRTYLTITEWGVKFEIPYGLGEVTYSINQNTVALYTTLGDDPITAGNNDHAVFMDRPLTWIKKSSVSAENQNSGIAIEGNVFTFEHPQALISENRADEVKEMVATALLWSAAHTLFAI